MLSKFLVGTALVLGSSASFASSACYFAKDYYCGETATPGVKFNCDNATVVEKCKTDDRFGSCFLKIQTAEVYIRFYKGYATDAKADCEGEKGTYTAD